MKKTLISAALALVLILTCLPLSVLAKTAAPSWTVPEGYNAHDYNKCAAFLEQTDEAGVKNGEKLSESYDVNDPATWGTYRIYDKNRDYHDFPRFEWNSADNELRIAKIEVCKHDTSPSWAVCGTLDVSDCACLESLNCYNNALTGLDVTNCTALAELNCSRNPLYVLDVSTCTALGSIGCNYNRLTELDLGNNTALTGMGCAGNFLTELDLSNNTALTGMGCAGNFLTELDLSNNTALVMLTCSDNALTGLDLSNNTALEYLDCTGNSLTVLNVGNNAALQYVECTDNALTELDLSGCEDLWHLTCTGNPLTSIIVPESSIIHFQSLRAEGNGYIGCAFSQGAAFIIYAYPNESAVFLGWYDASGELISEWSDYVIGNDSYTELIARFEGGFMPGDADGNGEVDIADALLTLRCAMGLLGFDEGQTAACDMDGDGALTIADALLIMRSAMGLITLD